MPSGLPGELNDGAFEESLVGGELLAVVDDEDEAAVRLVVGAQDARLGTLGDRDQGADRMRRPRLCVTFERARLYLHDRPAGADRWG